MAVKRSSSLAPLGSGHRNRVRFRMGFRRRKQHLDRLPFVAAELVGFRRPAGAREVAGVLLFFRADRSTDRIGAASLSRGATLTVRPQGAGLGATEGLAAVRIVSSVGGPVCARRLRGRCIGR